MSRDKILIGGMAKEHRTTINHPAPAFLEAGKNGLTRDTLRETTSDEVKKLRQENEQLKQSLAEAILETQRYKKSFGL